jgi:hypothetical protein
MAIETLSSLGISELQHNMFRSLSEAEYYLEAESYKHLGWLNSGIIPPKGHYHQVFSNRSGTTCLYACESLKVYYSVDMGD